MAERAYINRGNCRGNGDWAMFNYAVRASRTETELRDMAKSATTMARIGAATNPKTPADVLDDLAHDAQPEVRRAAARNSRTPCETLLWLAEDDDEGVRKTALATLPGAEDAPADTTCIIAIISEESPRVTWREDAEPDLQEYLTTWACPFRPASTLRTPQAES